MANENDKAVNLYTQAINLDENNYLLYNNRSVAYIRLKKYENALKDADKCIALKPDFVQVNITLIPKGEKKQYFPLCFRHMEVKVLHYRF